MALAGFQDYFEVGQFWYFKGELAVFIGYTAEELSSLRIKNGNFTCVYASAATELALDIDSVTFDPGKYINPVSISWHG